MKPMTWVISLVIMATIFFGGLLLGLLSWGAALPMFLGSLIGLAIVEAAYAAIRLYRRFKGPPLPR